MCEKRDELAPAPWTVVRVEDDRPEGLKLMMTRLHRVLGSEMGFELEEL